MYDGLSRRDVIHAAFRSGYPEIQDYTPTDRSDWLETYIDDFKHLKWFAANLAKEQQFTGIVLYSGDHTLRFGEGFYAVPLAALG